MNSYPWAFVYGLYFYVLFQVMYLVRFGSFNLSVSTTDLGLVIVGIGSVLMLMYTTRKLAHGKRLLLISFFLALPIAYVGALSGGLIGLPGVIIYGLTPFVIFLLIGYFCIQMLMGK